ncbi:hypothetical protein TNIN_297381 [Trichonephila inaurata madagascariensis]|uniref:Uncharacterized protein n=1 Tax=Trichonephila inaurata madagascariensis TaxID=2747483 RepID=A0A8X6X4B8_9ARAC|nr:hypothetical protein TNIN_297381 [Trichonephila inaurata madagascariensis]
MEGFTSSRLEKKSNTSTPFDVNVRAVQAFLAISGGHASVEKILHVSQYAFDVDDIAHQFSEELDAFCLPLEQIPISQRKLQLSQWIRYILLYSNIRLNIKLAALIQKNVDKLSSPNHLDKEIQQRFNALKPEGKVNLVTEFYLLLLFMLHLRFIYEKFPVKTFEIKFIAFKVGEFFLEALDECMARSRKLLY